MPSHSNFMLTSQADMEEVLDTFGSLTYLSKSFDVD